MVLYQLKNPETKEFILDKEGNAHEVHEGVLTGVTIQKADFEAQYVPFVKG